MYLKNINRKLDSNIIYTLLEYGAIMSSSEAESQFHFLNFKGIFTFIPEIEGSAFSHNFVIRSQIEVIFR